MYQPPLGTGMKVPIAIIIISNKEDIEQFRSLLSTLYTYFILNDTILSSHFKDDLSFMSKLENYKKLELINILSFCSTSLYKPGPHSIVSLKLPNIPQAIDFYFSSNCEIPCNKTDHTISKLFSLLDLSIIIKIIFKLLAEKSVILVSADSSVLNVICPALHKLILPIKWIYSYVPVVPVDKTKGLLELPSVYLFGVLRNQMKTEEIIKQANNELVVDCDTNQIYNDKKYVDFCPLPCSEFSVKSNITLTYYNKKIKKYCPDQPIKQRYQNITFLKEGKVIIDCDNGNKVVTELEDNYLKQDESIQLRKNIQQLKRETYFQSQNEVQDKINISDSDIVDVQNNALEENNGLSYEHQLNRLFTELIVKKIQDPNDPLLVDIKHYNCYNEFITSGKYQNDSNFSIVKNLSEKMNRNINNAFHISYEVPGFPKSKNVLELLKGQSKKIEDYFKVKEMVDHFYNSQKDNSTLNQINNQQTSKLMNFYGENGIIEYLQEFFRILTEQGKEEQLYINGYQLPIFQNVLSNGDEKNIFKDDIDDSLQDTVVNTVEDDEKFTTLKFENLDKEKDIEKCHQYWYYLSVLLSEYKKIKVNPHLTDLDYNSMIFDYHLKAESLDQKDYSYITFHLFLKTLTYEELAELENVISRKGNNKFLEILQDVVHVKAKDKKK